LELEYPHRIAAAAYRLRAHRTAQEQALPLAQLLERVFEHLWLIAVAEYLSSSHRDARLEERIREQLARAGSLTLGARSTLFSAIGEHLRQGSHDFIVREFRAPEGDETLGRIYDLQDLLKEVTELRNRTVHDGAEAAVSSPEQARAWKRKVWKVLEACAFLRTYPIFRVLSCSRTPDGNRIAYIELLTGHHQIPEMADRIRVPTDLDLKTEVVYLADARSGRVLELDPLLTITPATGLSIIHRFGEDGLVWQGRERARVRSDTRGRRHLDSLLRGDGTLERPEGTFFHLELDGRTAVLEIGEVVAERFTVRSLLASGGTALIYDAADNETGTDVAIKVLPPSAMADQADVAHFVREIDTLQELPHDGIVKVINFGDHQGLRYFVMERADGWPLPGERGAVATDLGAWPKPMERPLFRQVIEQVLAALTLVHKRGHVHRDLKPANILLFADGVVKLADFGLVWKSGQRRLTHTGHVLGTHDYMSPEQKRGDQLRTQADIYSVGVMIHELLTGKLPSVIPGLAGTDFVDLDMTGVLSPEELGADLALWRLVCRCLQLNARYRPANVGVVLTELDEAFKAAGGELEWLPGPIVRYDRVRTKDQDNTATIVPASRRPTRAEAPPSRAKLPSPWVGIVTGCLAGLAAGYLAPLGLEACALPLLALPLVRVGLDRVIIGIALCLTIGFAASIACRGVLELDPTGANPMKDAFWVAGALAATAVPLPATLAVLSLRKHQAQAMLRAVAGGYLGASVGGGLAGLSAALLWVSMVGHLPSMTLATITLGVVGAFLAGGVWTGIRVASEATNTRVLPGGETERPPRDAQQSER